jgi:hypothetical protein
LAAAAVAASIKKPTVMMMPQPSFSKVAMLGA